MYVVCFGNGLGNQMFQYAFYKSLVIKKPNVSVKMDIDYISKKDHNGFELDKVFGIERNECLHKQSIILSDLVPEIKMYRLINSLMRIKKILFGTKNSCICQDDTTCYYKEVYELSSIYSYIFRGVWINEKYFSDIKTEIIKNFTFINDLNNKNLEIAYNMKNENSVSIHVRRGDYLGSDLFVLDIDYYIKAIDYIKSKITNPVFYIFSNDLRWVEKNFNFLGNIIIVDWNRGEYSYIDMQLMSLCKHNIIANSTFSFWGAYLNRNKDKIVISPSKAGKSIKNPISCEDWIKI